MKQFIELVNFEYKKIFSRKISIITIALTILAMAIFSVGAVNSQDHYHYSSTELSGIHEDVKTIQQNKGYIDDNFINDAIKSNIELSRSEDNYLINDYGKFVTSKAYIKYILPYRNFVEIVNIIYESNDDNLSTNGSVIFNMSSISPINSINKLSSEEFYSHLDDIIINDVNGDLLLSDKEKNINLNMISSIKKPFYNDSFFAYENFLSLYKYIGLIILIAIAICTAPIFSNEYTTKVDQIIFCSKHGKSKLIYAKLFTGISFSFLYSLIVFSVFLFILQILFGFHGSACPIQLLFIYCSYNITMIQACIILIAIGVMISIIFSFTTCILSVKCKTPFTVIIINFIIILLPAFFPSIRNNRLLIDLIRLFPTKALDVKNIFSARMFGFASFYIKPLYFYILFTIIIACTLIPLTYKSYIKHQV